MPDLWLAGDFVGKLPAVGQSTRPTQPSIPLGSVNRGPGLRVAAWSKVVGAGMGCSLGQTLAPVCDAQRCSSCVYMWRAALYSAKLLKLSIIKTGETD